ncbi:hypothetical protein BC835DRAFT_1412193 [Cytidiella melzeri]|nr:hypothetical protein BC835DRAFT_1412193 [Cytidiella melzeri]
MQVISRTPKRGREGQADGNLKRQRMCDSTFPFPLINFLAQPTSPPELTAVFQPTPTQVLFILPPELDEMRHDRTRSVVALGQDKTQRAARPYLDHELVKGEITTTDLELRWDHAKPELSSSPDVAPVLSSVLPLPSVPSPPIVSTTAPLSNASSLSSISSTLTLCSSTGKDVSDSRPQPPVEDELNVPLAVIHTSASNPRRLQCSSQHHYSWDDHVDVLDYPSEPLPDDAKRVEEDLRIRLEQLKRLEALKKAREEQWAEAEAAGLFDDSDDSDVDDTEEERKENDVAEAREEADSVQEFPSGKSIAPNGSCGFLARTDTVLCGRQEPPSRLRPTLSHPLLPYLRTGNSSPLSSSSSTCTTSTMSSMTTGSRSPSASSLPPLTPSTLSEASTFLHCVRRYQEDGVWKTAGTFKDLPSFAHLESFNTMQSLGHDDALPQRADLKRKATGHLENFQTERRPFVSLSRQET